MHLDLQEDTSKNVDLVVSMLLDEHQGPENFAKIKKVRDIGPTSHQITMAKNHKEIKHALD